MKRNFLTDIVGIGDDVLKPKATFVETSLQPDDDAPSFSDDGYTEMRPSFDEADMLRAYEDPDREDSFAALPPQEAYENMKFQAPLSDGEKSILNSTPFLKDLSWVDDPDREEWLRKQSKGKNGAMDNILEDQMYGEDAEGGEEPGVTADGNDVGWGMPSFIKKAAHGIEHGVAKVAKVAESGILAAGKDFVKLNKMMITWPLKKLDQVAKMVAGAAATPIKHAARPLVNTSIAAVAKHAGHAKPTAADRANGNKIAVSTMIKNSNPLVKFGGLVLKWVGTGVSGEPTVLGYDGKGSKVYGWQEIDLLDSGNVSSIGFTGVEIAALAAGAAIAIGVVMKKMQGSAAAAAGPPAAGAVDPSTGLPVAQATDPTTGLPIDPTTGLPIDPATGQPVTPAAAAQYAAQQQASQASAPAVDPNAPPAYDPNAAAAAQPQAYAPPPQQAYAPPAYDPSQDPNAQYAQPAYDPSQDPNAYSSGDIMSDANDSLIFGDELNDASDTLVFGDAVTDAADTLIFGEGADYDFMVGDSGEPGVTSQGTQTSGEQVGRRQAPERTSAPPPRRRARAGHPQRRPVVSGDDSFAGFAKDMLGESGEGQKGRRAKAGPCISAEKYKELCLKRAQTTSGNEVPNDEHLVKAHKHLGKKLTEKGIRVKAPQGTPAGTSSGAWLYKLNPLYWTKSKEERNLIDTEKDSYEQAEKLKPVVEAGQRAVYQAEQAAAAKAASQDVEAKLKDIQASTASGKFDAMGAETVAIVGAAAAQGVKDAKATSQKAGNLADKLDAGQTLTPDEINQLRGCLKMCSHLTKLHDQLHAKTTSMGYHDYVPSKDPFISGEGQKGRRAEAGAFVGENVQEIMGENVQEIMGENVQEIMGHAFVGKNSGANDILGAAAGPTQAEWVALTAVAASQPQKLPAFMKQQGITLSKSDLAKLKVAAARAKIIMSHPAYKQLKLNKAALTKLTGDDESGADASNMGFSLGIIGKILTAPLAAGAVAASALTWGVNHLVTAPIHALGSINNWAAKKGGWGNMPGYGSSTPPATPAAPGWGTPALPPGTPGAPSWTPAYPMPPMPPGMPMPMMPPGMDPATAAALQQRKIAAYQAQAAAQAADDQAQQQLAAQAAAANAEADALDAQAQAQSDQDAALQAQYGIAPGGSDSMGEDEILGADFFSGYEVEPITYKDPKDAAKAKKITEEAQKNTPTGKKIRAGATIYHKAKKGDPKSRLAIAKMEAKAKKGDPQAKRDVNAVKAGKIAIHARGKAKTHIARKSAAEARKKRFQAEQKKMEAGLANRLSEHSRRKKLKQAAVVEGRAAHGDKKAKAVIAHHVKRAKAGDPKAKANVAALRLARHVRTSRKSPQDIKRQQQASKLIRKARHGHKKSIQQIALIHAAAQKGQPNAKRAMKHLTVMSHVERTVSTGKVSLPTSKKQLAARKKTKLTAQHKAAIVRYEMLKKRVASPMGTKEEALAAAKLGQKLGMKQEAGALAQKSSTMRSAKQPIKDMAATVAAAENGNPKAKAQIADTLASADRGEPKGISAAGHVAAVQAVAAVDKGLPMPKPVAEATMLVERAHAGDPKAKAQIAKIGEAAQDPSHPNHAEAVELAVAATAASTVLAATAGKAAANTHWKAEARKATGKHVEPDEQGKLKEELDAKVVKLKAGEGTYADGLRAREIAMALGMTALAAQISAIMPPADEGNPMSSLPEKPLAPITGWWSFVRESLKALTLSTPDPFENYREGTLSRGATPMLAPLRDTEAGGDRRKAIGADADQDGVVTPEVAMTKQEKRMNIVLKKMASGDKDATAAIMAVRKSALAGNAKAKGNYQLLLKVAKDTGFDMESSIPLQPAKV